jgi:hypothetical protein
LAHSVTISQNTFGLGMKIFTNLMGFAGFTSKTSQADSFKNMKVKTSYTPEDGHVGRNM